MMMMMMMMMMGGKPRPHGDDSTVCHRPRRFGEVFLRDVRYS